MNNNRCKPNKISSHLRQIQRNVVAWVRFPREPVCSVGLRGVCDHTWHRVGHGFVLRLHGQQAEFDERVPVGWQIHVRLTGRSITAGQLHVRNNSAGNSGWDSQLRHAVLDGLGGLLLCYANRRLCLQSYLLPTWTYQRIRGYSALCDFY